MLNGRPEPWSRPHARMSNTLGKDHLTARDESEGALPHPTSRDGMRLGPEFKKPREECIRAASRFREANDADHGAVIVLDDGSEMRAQAPRERSPRTLRNAAHDALHASQEPSMERLALQATLNGQGIS